MSHSVRLGINSSDPRVVSKNVDFYYRFNLSCEFKDDVDRYRPRIVIRDQFQAWPRNANYCYIPDLNRYYYIKKWDLQPGSTAVLDLECDVLASFSSQIKACTGVIERQQNYYNMYLPDDLPTQARERTLTINFPNSPMTSDLNHILIVSGTGG